MSYQLAQPSGDILKSESWERIIKFSIINLVIGVVVTLLITLVMSFFGNVNLYFSLLLSLGIVISASAFTLSYYENWRGCMLPKQ